MLAVAALRGGLELGELAQVTEEAFTVQAGVQADTVHIDDDQERIAARTGAVAFRHDLRWRVIDLVI